MTVWQKKEPPKYEENEEKTIQVMMTKNQHKMRRVISEAVLEKELTWHFEKGDCYHCFSWGDVDSLKLSAPQEEKPVNKFLEFIK